MVVVGESYVSYVLNGLFMFNCIPDLLVFFQFLRILSLSLSLSLYIYIYILNKLRDKFHCSDCGLLGFNAM
jgi:hypothetical protein